MEAMIAITVNGEVKTRASGETVGDLLRDVAPAGRRVAIELNGEVLPRSAHATHRLADGDCLEIVQAIGGG